jgi:hypothetical protein
MYGGTWTVVRLGFAGYMRCPVGKHWALVKPVKEADLTEKERQTVKRVDDREGVKLNGSIGLLTGLFSLGMSIVTQSWWLALGCALWITLWGVVFVRAGRQRRRPI